MRRAAHAAPWIKEGPTAPWAQRHLAGLCRPGSRPAAALAAGGAQRRRGKSVGGCRPPSSHQPRPAWAGPAAAPWLRPGGRSALRRPPWPAQAGVASGHPQKRGEREGAAAPSRTAHRGPGGPLAAPSRRQRAGGARPPTGAPEERKVEAAVGSSGRKRERGRDGVNSWWWWR